MSDPHETGDGISVTLKQDEPGGKFNDAKSPGAWIVFHGSPARVEEQILETFGLPKSETPLYELVQQANELFKATSNVRQGLGGKPLATSEASNVVPFKKKSADAGADEVFKQAAEGNVEQPPAADPILEAIEAASTIEGITRVRAENAEAIKPGSDYWDAYVAKGKALKNGGGAA